MIVSADYFIWFVTAMVFGVSASWLVVDSIRLIHALRDGRAAHDRHDRIFGSIIGLIVAFIGVAGALNYHGLW